MQIQCKTKWYVYTHNMNTNIFCPSQKNLPLIFSCTWDGKRKERSIIIIASTNNRKLKYCTFYCSTQSKNAAKRNMWVTWLLFFALYFTPFQRAYNKLMWLHYAENTMDTIQKSNVYILAHYVRFTLNC